MSALTDPIGPDLTATLRALKLGKLTATLPERLTLARQHNMPHADFLQLVLSDEVARREAGSIALRAKNAGLDPAMRTETWDPTAASLDNTLDYEYRRLTTVELLIIDDFALQPLTPAQTTDFYEIITERHRKASTVVTSNRDASEWLPLMLTQPG